MKKLVFAGAAVFLLAAPSAHAETLTLEQCVASALSRNPDARSKDFDVAAAEATRSGSKADMLPKLRAEATAQQWDRPFDLPFGPETFRIREGFTWNATVTLQQPLTGLFAYYEKYKVDRIGVDIEGLRRQSARRDLAYKVAETYLRLLEAERLAEVAKSSIAQLEGQLKQAQSLLENGIIGKNDELRAQLALAGARQREIQVRGQVLVTRASLAALIGAPPEASIEPAPIAGDPPAVDERSAASAAERALANRIELRELDARIGREDARASASRWRLYPNISAVGSYMHVAGSAFQLKDSAFVGAVATWEVWDWGANHSVVHVAEAHREQARLARESAAATIRVEAQRAFTELESAREALAVARTAREQAEENYRIVSKRFEQNAASSFDVVDAEALLTSARGQVENAFYGFVIARLALQRATGGTTPTLR